jgi:hypothetical protein
MKQISRLASGRVTVKTPTDVASDRYQLLDLASAEPNLGTAANGSILTTDTVGNRIWTDTLALQNLDVANDLTTNKIYTDNLFFANGDPYITTGATGAADQNTNIYNGIATVTTTVTLIDTMPLSGNSTVRWTISSQDVINSRYKTSTVDSINNGTTAYYNEYGVVLSDNSYEVATFTSNISGGNINLYAAGDSANVAIAYQRMALGSSTVAGYVPAGRDGAKGYTGSAGSVSIVVNSYTGNGSTSAFTLSTAPLDANQTIVSVGGILQPKSAYSVSGTTLTFSSTPSNGVPIEVTTFASVAGGGGGGNGYTGSAGSFSGTTSQAIVTTNTTASNSKTTGALRVAGGAGIGGNLHIGGTTYLTGDLIPSSNNTVNIGSTTNRFGTLYLAANTIDLGGTTITTAPSGELVFTTQAGNVSLTANAINFLSSVANTSTNQGDLNVTGNLSVDRLYVNSYFYANGASFSGGLGYTGSRGIQGIQGTTGYTGSAGETGATGAGYTGSAGSQGTQGAAGYTGSAGTNGINGTVGYTGSAGTNGSNGYTGSVGAGYTGSQGVAGATGTTGANGYTGSRGADGASGGGYLNLLMPGAITAPVTGTARFYPPANLTVNTVYANLSANPTNGSLTFVIKKNGTSTGTTFTLSSALMDAVSTSISLTTTDYLTVDVTGSAMGSDLHIKLKYA